MLETNTLSELHLFYPLLFILVIILTFVLARVHKDKLDNKKDIHFKDKNVEVNTEAFKRIGEIKNGTPNEIILNMQNVENNKEIFTHDKKIESLEEKVDFLVTENNNLRTEYSILKNRFDALITVVGREG